MNEMPSITNSAYSSSSLNLAAMGANAMVGLGALNQNSGLNQAAFHAAPQAKQPKQEAPKMAVRRLVQVFIADTNDNIPLEQSLLYSGEQKFTDATDQELFFEIDINSILKAYNEKRIKLVDKKVKERTEYLEAAKIRDLKMVVVTVASF